MIWPFSRFVTKERLFVELALHDNRLDTLSNKINDLQRQVDELKRGDGFEIGPLKRPLSDQSASSGMIEIEDAAELIAQVKKDIEKITKIKDAPLGPKPTKKPIVGKKK